LRGPIDDIDDRCMPSMTLRHLSFDTPWQTEMG
jgi:hypothetical protein